MVVCRIYLILKGTRYSASGRLVYVWVRSGLVINTYMLTKCKIPKNKRKRLINIFISLAEPCLPWAGVLDLYFVTSNGLWCCSFSWSNIFLPLEQTRHGKPFTPSASLLLPIRLKVISGSSPNNLRKHILMAYCIVKILIAMIAISSIWYIATY